ncbi:hypothetical protein F5Y17DRAFT_436915 [Xylariaceae sp. FL0594]|nr:hypothetical protein F5Y17DRAFT_436915 [Xylariaceae sp. FL0594]
MSATGNQSDVLLRRQKRNSTDLDYAVNCAGIPRQTAADLTTVDETEYDSLHDVNAKGVLHCLQEEISAMKDQKPLFANGGSGERSIGPGSIINITSLSAVFGTAQSTTYVASKFAARGIIKCAVFSFSFFASNQALENRASGLRTNEVCPGFTNTPMLQRGIEKQPEIKDILNKSMPLEPRGNARRDCQRRPLPGKPRRKLRQRAVDRRRLWSVSQHPCLVKS